LNNRSGKDKTSKVLYNGLLNISIQYKEEKELMFEEPIEEENFSYLNEIDMVC